MSASHIAVSLMKPRYDILWNMRLSKKKLNPISQQRALSVLLPYVKDIRITAGLENFLGMIFTNQEKEVILRRMLVIDLLRNGMSYREIERKLEISKITISKIKDILEKRGYGRNPKRKRTKIVYYNPKYNSSGRKKKDRPLLGYYKGTASII